MIIRRWRLMRMLGSFITDAGLALMIGQPVQQVLG